MGMPMVCGMPMVGVEAFHSHWLTGATSLRRADEADPNSSGLWLGPGLGVTTGTTVHIAVDRSGAGNRHFSVVFRRWTDRVAFPLEGLEGLPDFDDLLIMLNTDARVEIRLVGSGSRARLTITLVLCVAYARTQILYWSVVDPHPSLVALEAFLEERKRVAYLVILEERGGEPKVLSWTPFLGSEF
jgi:hypothetical protein